MANLVFGEAIIASKEAKGRHVFRSHRQYGVSFNQGVVKCYDSLVLTGSCKYLSTGDTVNFGYNDVPLGKHKRSLYAKCHYI